MTSDNIYYVYTHSRETDGSVFYVGKGKGDRAYSLKSRNAHWRNIAKKNGYTVDIVREQLSEQNAFKYEIELIASIGIDNLANICSGGKGASGNIHTEETKELLSDLAVAQFADPEKMAAHKERERNKWKCEKRRAAMALIIKNYFASNPDAASESSARARAMWLDSDYKARVIETKKKNSNTTEAKKMYSDAQKKRFSDPEQLEKLRAQQKKLGMKIKCTTTGKVYSSQSEAAKDLGILQGGISQCVLGRIKSFKGYSFERVLP